MEASLKQDGHAYSVALLILEYVEILIVVFFPAPKEFLVRMKTALLTSWLGTLRVQLFSGLWELSYIRLGKLGNPGRRDST